MNEKGSNLTSREAWAAGDRVAPRVVLASASPRRRELLHRLLPDFDVISSEVEERLEPGPVADAVAELAEAKARAIATRRPDAVVVGADTVVVVDDEAIGKPADRAEARATLQRLRGRAHEVLTGVAVIARNGPARRGTERTRVMMARYPDDLVERYVASGAPLDKAGAYAIQDLDGALVESIVGSYSNVVGLPLALTARLLTAAGVPVNAPSSS